jgi:hypothetical protein
MEIFPFLRELYPYFVVQEIYVSVTLSTVYLFCHCLLSNFFKLFEGWVISIICFKGEKNPACLDPLYWSNLGPVIETLMISSD